MKKNVPAVSIIIPMYNVEKYIGECLDSILNQTFTDYEVIAVDDCSTDKTCEVVESYLPKFNRGGGEKLYLLRSKVNSSGRPGIPRNTGIRFSRGEYIMFVDSDDAIMPTALEELYSSAKHFQADVVHCGKYYKAPDETVTTDKNLLTTDSLEIGTLAKNPFLLSNNLEERIKLFAECRINWMTCCNFVRRNFLMQNNINFPDMSVAEDIPYSLKLLCESKKFLCLPNIVYVYRKRDDSQSNTVLNADKRIHHRVKSVFKGIEYLDKYMSSIDFFVKRPDFRSAVLNFFKERQSYDVLPLYAQIPAHLLDPLIRRELSEVKDKTALTAFLFARMNLFNVQLLRAQNLLRQQPKEVQDFQRNNEIIQRQQLQIQQLQQQLRNVHDIFR